ncbi:hypothetical protein DAPPUDRAFT_108421 [Daphnia pulex]|uniref:Uncharacterized protein n=1 Tax=Daphnia pulex TaxID=6669 RepID=E9H054_DAPPU|nr:hypothetical protein DAPPUDRAFT_108421 [Daphnia pulex]|eukprot:EFX74932.1 hypothetical protein DAPPUDRAFT_108421 [Daphnia pulex]
MADHPPGSADLTSTGMHEHRFGRFLSGLWSRSPSLLRSLCLLRKRNTKRLKCGIAVRNGPNIEGHIKVSFTIYYCPMSSDVTLTLTINVNITLTEVLGVPLT